MTMAGAVMSRAWAMNGVLVPLPAPGAPPSQMNSPGNFKFSRRYFSSRSTHTPEKMSWASLISRSGAAGTGRAAEFASLIGTSGGRGIEQACRTRRLRCRKGGLRDVWTVTRELQ